MSWPSCRDAAQESPPASIFGIASRANGSMAVLIAAACAGGGEAASRTSNRSARDRCRVLRLLDRGCQTCRCRAGRAAARRTRDMAASGQDADTCWQAPLAGRLRAESVQPGHRRGSPVCMSVRSSSLGNPIRAVAAYRRRFSGGGVMRRSPIQPRARRRSAPPPPSHRYGRRRPGHPGWPPGRAEPRPSAAKNGTTADRTSGVRCQAAGSVRY